MKTAAALLLLVGTALAPPAAGQEPSPEPERLFQDELDLQANANFVQGSGARAFGMGGAFLARADDATAASWNPAGLSYLRAPELSVVLVGADLEAAKRAEGFAVAERDLTGDITVRRRFVQDSVDESDGRFPDFLAFAWPWEKGEASGAVQLSFQRVIPFTSGRRITDTVTFLGPNGPDEVRESTRSVETRGGYDILALGAGVRLSRHVRIGLTANRWFNGYEQTVMKAQRRFPSRQDSSFELDSGWNIHVGTILSPLDSLNIGGVLKTGFTAGMTLRRSRTDVFPPQTMNSYARDDLQLTLPSAYGVGASWRPRSNLTLSLDFTRTRWSIGRIRNFFTLDRTDPNDQTAPVPTEPDDFFPDLPYPSLNDHEQQDTEQLRAGIEYVVIKNRLKWPIRVGYFTDRQYFRTFAGGAPRFDGFTAGTGLILSKILLDVAYVRESGSYTDRNIELDPRTLEVIRGPARNEVKSHKFYASVIYRFSRRP